MANEIKRFYGNSQASPVARSNWEAGSFYLQIGVDASNYINFNDDAAAITTALEACPQIGSGNVSVTLETDGFTFEFVGALANTDIGDYSVQDNTLKQSAAASATTTSNGSADTYSPPTDGGGFTDGDDNTVAAVQTITFTPAPTQGQWTFAGSTYDWNQDFSASAPFGWGVSGTPSSGTVTITRGDTASGQSPFSYSLGTLGYLSATGNYQIVTVSTTATEGTLNVTLDGSTSSDWNATDNTPAGVTGWSGGGSTGTWLFTRDIRATDVSCSASEGSTPLRKALSGEVVTVQEGSAGGGGATNTGSLLLLGVG